jgi:hypothetical protein
VSSWIVVPDLLSLRGEFDQLAPNRDRASDGTIGDQAHAERSSDHNADDTPGSNTPHSDSDTIAEVHALDVDSTGPWPDGMTMAKAFLVLRQKMISLSTRAPLAYLIFDRQWCEYPTWAVKPYTLSDPHTGHLHASSRYGAGATPSNPETYAGPWGLLEAFMALSDDDKKWIKATVDASVKAALADVPHDVWAFDPGTADWAGVSSATYPDVNNGTVAPSTALESILARGDAARRVLDQVAADLKAHTTPAPPAG